MKNNTYITTSDLETQKIGEDFAKELSSGENVFLYGDLGFGKTTFAKGVAKGLNIKSRIISPTFVIVRQHQAQQANIKVLYHIDLYRIESQSQLAEVGIKEIMEDTKSVKLIEWPEKIESGKHHWEVKLSLSSDNVRTININKI